MDVAGVETELLDDSNADSGRSHSHSHDDAQHDPEQTVEPDSKTAVSTDKESCSDSPAVDTIIWVYIGLITGFGSGLTGTSGPVVSLPQIFLTRPKLEPFMAVAYVD